METRHPVEDQFGSECPVNVHLDTYCYQDISRTP